MKLILATVYQSTANYSCSVGYEIHGEATLKCLWNSTWNSIPPNCIPIDCGPIEPILNGFVLGALKMFLKQIDFCLLFEKIFFDRKQYPL